MLFGHDLKVASCAKNVEPPWEASKPGRKARLVPACADALIEIPKLPLLTPLDMEV